MTKYKWGNMNQKQQGLFKNLLFLMVLFKENVESENVFLVQL